MHEESRATHEEASATARPRKEPAKDRPWGAVRHRCKRYYVRFTAQGREYERGPFSTWAAADKMRRRARTLLEAGTPVADVLAACFNDDTTANMTFRQASEPYLAYAATRKRATSLEDDAYRLGLLGRALWAGKRLSAVTPADLNAWMEKRLRPRLVKRLRARGEGETVRTFRLAPDRWTMREAAGASAPTINKDMHLVSSVYRWAQRNGLVTENPVRGVELPQAKGRECGIYLTAQEAQALVDVASPVLRPVLVTALHTGMRRGEQLALRWRSVDLERRELRIEAETSKSGRGRTVPLTAALGALLAELHKGRPRPALDGSDAVFTLADGEPMSNSALRSMFDSATRSCTGLPLAKRNVLRWHDLRHTAASLMVAAGVPIFDVSKVLGHASVSVTMRYAHFAPEAGRSAIERLGNVLAPAAKPSWAKRAGSK